LMEAYWNRAKEEEPEKKKPGFIRRHAGKIAGAAALAGGAALAHKTGHLGKAAAAAQKFGAKAAGAAKRYGRYAAGAAEHVVRDKARQMGIGGEERMRGMESLRAIPLGNLRESRVQELLYRSGLKKRPETPKPSRGQRAKAFIGRHKKKLALAAAVAALAGGYGLRNTSLYRDPFPPGSPAPWAGRAGAPAFDPATRKPRRVKVGKMEKKIYK